MEQRVIVFHAHRAGIKHQMYFRIERAMLGILHKEIDHPGRWHYSSRDSFRHMWE